MPKTIAFVSTMNAPRITGWRTTNRKPAATDASPTRSAAPPGGIFGSAAIAAMDAPKVARSTR